MLRSVDKWLPGYLASMLRRPHGVTSPCHLIFCIADHFEPFRLRPFDTAQGSGGQVRGDASWKQAMSIVERWAVEYPRLAAGYRDADGKPPRHTFFYPQEEYDADCLNRLSELCGGGFGEVEIQLHHRHDTPEGLRDKLTSFRNTLHERHGLLGCDADGRVRFGFVHGNWALCNSRPDGDWCGVNEELGILAETGCYADFTFPSAPSPTQPRMVNAMYRAADRPGRPRGADTGERSEVRGQRSERETLDIRQNNENTMRHLSVEALAKVDAPCATRSAAHHSSPITQHSPLLLITGPLALDWRRRKWGILPRLENGAVTAANPPTPARAALWVRQHICVRGRPDWVFVKVHTHGCVAENANVLLGEPMRRFHDDLKRGFNDGKLWSLHYVTAREMCNVVRAAEDGKSGNPGEYRDYQVLSPVFQARISEEGRGKLVAT